MQNTWLNYVQFSVARHIASIISIPLLTTSLDHLESLSLLPILLGESIASTSLAAASTSIDAISNLLDANDEASFSLATFVTLVRTEWAEHGPVGRSVTEVARAVAAWAAIQGFTKQWSEERWLRGTTELTQRDFKPPKRPSGKTQFESHGRRRTSSRVSVTDDVIIPEQLSQVISADIGRKDTPVDAKSLTTAPSNGVPPIDSSVLFRSNYETWKNLRRLSKMVLAGYGGAGLLFFGTPLQPTEPNHIFSQSSAYENRAPSSCTDSEVKNMEEDILINLVEEAEAEAMSPPMRNVAVSDVPSFESASNCKSHYRSGIINPTLTQSSATSSAYSWWNVLLGKHDREIFEGFAFTPADDSDKATNHSSLSPSSEPSSPTHSRLHSLSSAHGNPCIPGISTITSDSSHKKEGPKPPTAIIGDMRHMPRFWVLTDHGRQQVVLVVRGVFDHFRIEITVA
jgi:sn1-specific diacylglycerol lipase